MQHTIFKPYLEELKLERGIFAAISNIFKHNYNIQPLQTTTVAELENEIINHSGKQERWKGIIFRSLNAYTTFLFTILKFISCNLPFTSHQKK